MRWEGERESENVEDRRGMRPSGPVMVGGGLGTFVIIIIFLLLGGDPQALFNQIGQGPPPGQQGPPGGAGGAPQLNPEQLNPEQQQLTKFVKVVLASTEDVWQRQFREMGRQYRDPKLVLFGGRVESACGLASSAVGPFYCPSDQQVYLDLSFFEEMKHRFHASGDFAQAYVIAHEVGHHVQKLLGISDKVDSMRRRASEVESNELSVRLELQADFLAGVWANHAQQMRHILEEGDVEEAIRAATAIGDDRLQMQSRGMVVPDSFTHGTSAQRVKWFTKGLKTGDMEAGDTFSIPYDQL
jgi:predicted metalloprotease